MTALNQEADATRGAPAPGGQARAQAQPFVPQGKQAAPLRKKRQVPHRHPATAEGWVLFDYAQGKQVAGDQAHPLRRQQRMGHP